MWVTWGNYLLFALQTENLTSLFYGDSFCFLLQSCRLCDQQIRNCPYKTQTATTGTRPPLVASQLTKNRSRFENPLSETTFLRKKKSENDCPTPTPPPPASGTRHTFNSDSNALTNIMRRVKNGLLAGDQWWPVKFSVCKAKSRQFPPTCQHRGISSGLQPIRHI